MVSRGGGISLIPYSNRIEQGRFSFNGEDYRLTPNMRGETHSIHGNAWEHEWKVAQHDVDRAILISTINLKLSAISRSGPFLTGRSSPLF